ncbi:hypothetical protein BGAL_0642g00050 [Botrytis galanthina]|uniref:Uncharacterized protein n=1 Tax=Botrytis galanthina TaxID=278940 RepID=A0A4S8QLU9_9HELO|nr:hypothetical protein BGAL_0642g00050 [Botrytis galanthina]
MHRFWECMCTSGGKYQYPGRKMEESPVYFGSGSVVDYIQGLLGWCTQNYIAGMKESVYGGVMQAASMKSSDGLWKFGLWHGIREILFLTSAVTGFVLFCQYFGPGLDVKNT